MPTISRLMGDAHKVRNFYNDIYDPFSPLANYTSDTHDIAAKLLTPYAGTSLEVAFVMSGSPSSAVSGTHGLYGLSADAGRDAATERGLRPNQMQSIAWTAAQGLFGDKRPETIARVQRMWRNRDIIHPDDIRDDIHDFSNGIDLPYWANYRGPGAR